MPAISPCVTQRRATKVRRAPDLNTGSEPMQIRLTRYVWRTLTVHRNTLVELKVGLRELRNGRTGGGDRRSRNHGIVTSICQTIENTVEVVCRISSWLQLQSEMRTDRAHQIDIEAVF